MSVVTETIVQTRSMIRAISFDADGTLWDFDAAMRRALTATLRELRRLVPGEATMALTTAQLSAIRDEVAEGLYGRRVTMEEIRLAAFARTLELLGSPGPKLAAQLTDFYLERRFTDIELYSDVLPTLNMLRASYRLGLLSNGNTYPERCGLDSYFDFVVFAQDHEARKPDARFYRAVLAHARLDETALIHVGDSLSNDVASAQAVGIRAIWLNRDGQPNTTATHPEAEIASLAELATVLDRLDP